jgi:phosphocarrier protein
MDDTEHAERSVVVANALGLHIGAAGQLVELANTFPCDIRIANAGRNVNAKSIMGVLMLVASQGATLEIKASGPRAGEAADALALLVANKFNEEQ